VTAVLNSPDFSDSGDDRRRYPEAYERYCDGRKLTARQRQVYRLIVRHAEATGSVPTYRQILVALGFRSINCVKQWIDILERRGLVRRGEGNELLLPRRRFTSSPILEGCCDK